MRSSLPLATARLFIKTGTAIAYSHVPDKAIDEDESWAATSAPSPSPSPSVGATSPSPSVGAFACAFPFGFAFEPAFASNTHAATYVRPHVRTYTISGCSGANTTTNKFMYVRR